MRSFLARVTNSLSGVGGNVSKRNEIIEDDYNNYTFGSSADDPMSPIILAAATSLSDFIQGILVDPNSLQENIDGFLRLLTLLDDTTVIEDSLTGLPIISESSCLEVLIRSINNTYFVEKCNEIQLGSSLMHILRLLRMYEIKQSKVGYESCLMESNLEYTKKFKSNPKQGITFFASSRVCQVFNALMSDQFSIELIKSSLPKLLTYPLSTFPVVAAHLQVDSASIITTIAKTSLTPDLINWLHENRVIELMINQLKELASISFSLEGNHTTDDQDSEIFIQSDNTKQQLHCPSSSSDKYSNNSLKDEDDSKLSSIRKQSWLKQSTTESGICFPHAYISDL